MMNEQILKLAIQKALDNGWRPLPKNIEPNYGNIMANWYNLPIAFVFSHSFAKAFWGEEEVEFQTEEGRVAKIIDYQIAWRFHLQQMVLEEQPLKYIEKWL